MDRRWPVVGDHVIYCDEKSEDHDALVTANWGNPETHPAEYGPCLNAVFVSQDENRKDQYGRQIERPSSVTHVGSAGVAHGRYWRWPDEARKAYQAPSSI